MGITFSCPFANFEDLDSRVESYLVRTLSLGSDDMKNVLQPRNFNDQITRKSKILKSFGSGNMILEGTLTYKRREFEAKIALRTLISDKEEKKINRSDNPWNRAEVSPKLHSISDKDTRMLPVEYGKHRDQAAVKLQKTYKSFRTRRQLADCAVLVEHRWWKLLDSVELKHSSISYFDTKKLQTAVSRWSRALTRTAKVGKGLSKDGKARKLALQHWLEAIDPRHRYGHNLRFYYNKWLQADSKQPFFYWLDIGEGKEINLERCARPKLQQDCIKYLGPIEREAYEIVIEGGKFLYKQSRRLLDTRGGPPEAKWIFVLSVSKILYVGMKKKGTFQHSSFLAGGAALSAGRLVAEDGIIKSGLRVDIISPQRRISKHSCYFLSNITLISLLSRNSPIMRRTRPLSGKNVVLAYVNTYQSRISANSTKRASSKARTQRGLILPTRIVMTKTFQYHIFQVSPEEYDPKSLLKYRKRKAYSSCLRRQPNRYSLWKLQQMDTKHQTSTYQIQSFQFRRRIYSIMKMKRNSKNLFLKKR
uniref:Calmodulin binding protein n=1 Tax=Solanum tuberosum TaxID=4113 RepID=M1AF91_SOLTU